MAVPNPTRVVQLLREFQRTVRNTIVRSPSGPAMHEISRASSADTIYRIDTEIDPLLVAFCQKWGEETPLVLVAEGMEDEHGQEGPVTFPRGTREKDAKIRVIVDPIDGTRGIMYDKRAAWALAGVAPNKGAQTRLRDIEVAVMTELPTSKMGQGDVLWAIRGQGAHAIREAVEEPTPATLEQNSNAHLRGRPLGSILTGLGKVDAEQIVEALHTQKAKPDPMGKILVRMGYVTEADVQIALAFQRGENAPAPVEVSAIAGTPVALRPSPANTINHGFASVSNFFPGTKGLASELMEYLARHLIGEADVTKATVFDDQYISTGGQFYEIIVGHDRFNADLRPAFYRLQNQPEGLCCHPYDCATLLIAEEAGAIITDEKGRPLDGPFDTTTGLSWVGYANAELRRQIEPLLQAFLKSRQH